MYCVAMQKMWAKNDAQIVVELEDGWMGEASKRDRKCPDTRADKWALLTYNFLAYHMYDVLFSTQGMNLVGRELTGFISSFYSPSASHHVVCFMATSSILETEMKVSV